MIMKRKKSWKSYSLVARNSLRSNIDSWNSGDSDIIRAVCRIFYDLVFSSGTVDTGLISKSAIHSDKRCNDHYLSPQFVCRMIMDHSEVYLNDSLMFDNFFYLCRSVIKVTAQENQDLKKLTKNKGNEFRVYVPTNLKYQYLNIKLYERTGRSWKKSIQRENSILDIPLDLLEYESNFLVS